MPAGLSQFVIGALLLDMHSPIRGIPAFLALLAFAAAAHAQTGHVVNAAANLCLQVNGPIASGSRLQTATCVANSANQNFTRTASNELRIGGSLCVDAYGGGKQGAEVGLWGCQGSLNERWTPNNGFLVTENNFCMAVDGGNRAPGTRIIVYSCINDPSQKWSGPTASSTTPPPTPTPTPTPTVSLASQNPTIMNMIATSYQQDFGRAARQDELAYWGGMRSNDARLVTRDAFQQNNIAFLKSSQPDRQSMIQAAFRDTWGVNIPVNSKEMQFWEPKAAQGQVLYSSLKRANDGIKTTNPGYVPGQPIKVAMKQPYSVQGIEEPVVATWRVLVTLFQTDYQSLATNLTTPSQYSGPTPPDRPSNLPPVSGLPAMRIPNPHGIAGPYVLASTYHENPAQSFCLDTGSWNPGSPVIAAPCHGGDSQLFDVDASNRIYLARTPNRVPLCLDGGDKPWPGDPRKKQLVLNTCTNSATQKWYTGTIPGLHDGAPYVNAYWPENRGNASMGQIQNQGNGFCIDIDGGRTGQSNPVIAYDCVPRKINSPRPWNQIWGAGHVMTSGAAYLFMRYNPPQPAGHIGWGIQLADGSWEGGTMDGAEQGTTQFLLWKLDTPGVVAKGDNNWAWRHHFANEQQLRDYFLAGRVSDSQTTNNHYDRYWKVNLNGGVLNTAAAFSLEAQSWDWGYGVLGNNCMDVSYKVLRAYGWGLPAPANSGDIQKFAPKNWFAQVVGSAEGALWLHGK